MASGAYGSANNMTVTTSDKFIPEMWSDEVIAAYKANLVFANVVMNMNVSGKKGDTIHIPKATNMAATAKAANTAVTIQNFTDTEVTVSLNKHYEASYFIEDIVMKQALPSLRQIYTDRAGYALAKQIDSDLVALGSGFNSGSGTTAYNAGYIGGDGATLYVAGSNNASALTAAGIRAIIQKLDDNDVPLDNRFFVVPPVVKKTILGISDFTFWQNVGEAGRNNSVRNGLIGDVYGVPVYVTTNAATTSGSTAARACLLGHRDAMVLAVQEAVRTQTQYKQEYLADLFTADTIYGVAELRDTSAYAIIVPAV